MEARNSNLSDWIQYSIQTFAAAVRKSGTMTVTAGNQDGMDHGQGEQALLSVNDLRQEPRSTVESVLVEVESA